MKTNFASGKILRATMLSAVLGVGACLCQAAPPPPPSPVLTNGAAGWDCVISGQKGEQGILFITFTTIPDVYGNYTFTLSQIHTKVSNGSSSGSNGRNAGGGVGRGGSSTGTPNSESATNIFGFWSVPRTGIPAGSWGYDAKGNTLGFFIEIVDLGGEGTNATFITNAVSFTAKVTPNKRFTAKYSSSMGGNGTYTGVPMKGVTGLDGHWTGTEKIGSLSTYEFFNLTPMSTSEGYTNIYDIIGSGPGYALSGVCMASSQKKIAFTDFKTTGPTNPPSMRATTGSLVNSKTSLGGNTKGLIDSGTNANYNAFWVSP
jgi:hypothetical protein